jgi:hypothetical protein
MLFFCNSLIARLLDIICCWTCIGLKISVVWCFFSLMTSAVCWPFFSKIIIREDKKKEANWTQSFPFSYFSSLRIKISCMWARLLLNNIWRTNVSCTKRFAFHNQSDFGPSPKYFLATQFCIKWPASKDNGLPQLHLTNWSIINNH